jgi:hypothetical protein
MAAKVAGVICAFLVVVQTAAAGPAAPPIAATVFDHTGLRLADIVWTGEQLLYVENTTNTIWTRGKPPRVFASMPKQVEETRCVVSPGAHGFPAGHLYCHAPGNTVYRVGPDGHVAVFAKLPETDVSDGALAFDDVGRFGFALVAATGRSGAPTPGGGTVYTIDANGTPTRVGRYAGPGGADELVVTPKGFGSGGGEVALTVDAGASGSVQLMAPDGRTRRIARLQAGPNPIVVVPPRHRGQKQAVPAGLYVTDTNSTNVFFAPAARLSRYAGRLIVGAELGAGFWVISPHGSGFQTRPLALTLPGSKLNLEGATYVG